MPRTTLGPEQDVFVEDAVANAYDGPVVLLTSGGTFSAAENFTLAMRVRDNVTIMGEPTSGHLSDLHDVALPNDWEASYSGDQYRAADGLFYEGIGIPVDITSNLDVTAVAGGSDPTYLQARAALTP